MTQSTFEITALCKKSKWIADHVSYFTTFFRKGEVFTTDKLHDVFDPAPNDNYWGALMACLQEKGIIRPTGKRVTSKREKANYRKIDEWEVVL
jgi:hypothetical protein